MSTGNPGGDGPSYPEDPSAPWVPDTERPTSDRRATAIALLRLMLPCGFGSLKFAEICPAPDFSQGMWTCTFLAHWMWWRLGCIAALLVNRTDTAAQFRFQGGHGVEKAIDGARALNAWRSGSSYSSTNRPRPGDVLHWQWTTPQAPPHGGAPDWGDHLNVFMSRDGLGHWTTGDAGEGTAQHQIAEVMIRDIMGGDPGAPQCKFAGGWKVLRGWIDLDLVPLGEPPAQQENGSPLMPLAQIVSLGGAQ